MLIFVVEDDTDGDELPSAVPQPEMQNNVEERVEITESVECSSSGQNNVECQVETTELVECNSSGQDQQQATVSNLLYIETFSDAWLIKIVSE